MPPVPAAGRRPPAVRRGRRRRRARCGTTPTRTARRCTRSSSSSADVHNTWNCPALPKSVSLSMLRVIVRTRRLRSSSGAMVLKIVASRSDARPSSASAVASSCATFASSNAAATPATSGTSAFGSSSRLHQLHGDVRVELPGREGEVPHDVRQLLGRHHRDDAGQVTERGEDGGRLRGDHRRTVDARTSAPAPPPRDRRYRRRCPRSPAAAPASARRTPPADRRRSSSRSSARDRPVSPARGRRPLRARTAPRNRAARWISEGWPSCAQISTGPPRARRSAASRVSSRSSLVTPSYDTSPRNVRWRRSRSCRSAAASAIGPCAVNRRDAVDQERVGRDADAEGRAERRLADRFAQSLDR